MNLPLFLKFALIGGILYGIANPFMGKAQAGGLNAAATVVMAAIGQLIIGIVFGGLKSSIAHPGGSAVAIAVGIAWGFGALCINQAMNPALKPVYSLAGFGLSLIPFISAIVAMVMFKEWDKIIWTKFIGGGSLLLTGLWLISNCKK